MQGLIDTILTVWLDEIGPEGWYAATPEIDARIATLFESVWQVAVSEGGFGLWLTDARGALAWLLLTDQFPRNMFRGQGRAFASDPLARAAAKGAIEAGWDMTFVPAHRQFFYLPMMHSESLVDQDRSVELYARRMPDGAPELAHAHAHRAVIRRFGRFPTRNAALGRETTPEETAWLASGGYGRELRRYLPAVVAG